MIYAQWYILICIVIVTLVNIYYDINGRPAKKRMGLIGVLATLIGSGSAICAHYIAGAFSKIF